MFTYCTQIELPKRAKPIRYPIQLHIYIYIYVLNNLYISKTLCIQIIHNLQESLNLHLGNNHIKGHMKSTKSFRWYTSTWKFKEKILPRIRFTVSVYLCLSHHTTWLGSQVIWPQKVTSSQVTKGDRQTCCIIDVNTGGCMWTYDGYFPETHTAWIVLEAIRQDRCR